LEAKSVMLRVTNMLGQSLPVQWSVDGSELRTELPAARGLYLIELLDRSSGESLGVKRVVVR
jgi:hypothetical protein